VHIRSSSKTFFGVVYSIHFYQFLTSTFTIFNIHFYQFLRLIISLSRPDLVYHVQYVLKW